MLCDLHRKQGFHWHVPYTRGAACTSLTMFSHRWTPHVQRMLYNMGFWETWCEDQHVWLWLTLLGESLLSGSNPCACCEQAFMVLYVAEFCLLRRVLEYGLIKLKWVVWSLLLFGFNLRLPSCHTALKSFRSWSGLFQSFLPGFPPWKSSGQHSLSQIWQV